MADHMQAGQVARLVIPEIKGTIIDTTYNKETFGLDHLLEWTGADGEINRRWFAEGELEGVI